MFKNVFVAVVGLGLMATLVAFPVWLTHGFHEAVVAVLTPGQ